MKDIVENRQRLSLGQKAEMAKLALQENGVLWTALLGTYYAFSGVADKAFAAMARRRIAKNLPGLNSAAMNRLIWNSWDWSAAGEEWTPSEEWKQSVLACVLRPNIDVAGTVVEIGPGGGRWTEELQKRAAKVFGLDISQACVDTCTERFKDCDNVEFRVSSGTDLAGVDDGSVDSIWSFDVFVHINEKELRAYAAEFARVLKSGGGGVLHHGTAGGATGGWRSDVTDEKMREVLIDAGLEVVDQYRSWTDPDGTEHQAGLYDDAITVFRKK
jgi:SAM-dependent methyltransferase